jgi:3-dehydroquinate dehydratase I
MTRKAITVKGITIGEGLPKICVSLIGQSLPQILEEVNHLKTLDADIVEWRVDFFEQVEQIDAVRAALQEIRAVLMQTPLIFTFRSAKEGGEREITVDYYFELNKVIAESGLADLIDVELFHEEEAVKTLIDSSHRNGVYVIVSNHDFQQTPPKEELLSRLCKAQELGGDIPKIAVMPTSSADVLTLLDAANTMNEQFADRPFITMSMAGKGVISRLAGEVFGSAITFGAAKTASAPGQVPVKELRSVLQLLHSNLKQ